MEEDTNDIKLLNIIVSNKKELRDFVASCNEDFFVPGLRRFAKHLFSYYKTYSSCPTLDTLLEFATSGTNSNLEEYLIDTWKRSEEFVDPREYTFIVQKLKHRKNMELLTEVKSIVPGEIDDAMQMVGINRHISKIVNEIQSLNTKKIYSESTLKNAVEEYVDRFKGRQTTPELAMGVMSGFSVLDFYTNGLRPSECAVICANTGGGKSIFLLNIAVNMWMGKNKLPDNNKDLSGLIQSNGWQLGNDVLFVSLEMPKDEIEDRVISCMCGINSLDLMKGKLVDNEPTKLALGLKFWKNYPNNFKIVDVPRGCSMNQIQTIFDECCLEFRPKVVIIDYLGLMTDNGEDSNADWEKLMKVAEQMHEFARTNEVVVYSGLQLKTTKPGESGVGIHMIGRSSLILHNVNLALQIENRENEDMRPDSIIHCIKFRRGPKFVMNNLRKEFMYTRFADTGLPNAEPEKEMGKFGEDLSGLMSAILDTNEDVSQEQE